jgi:hypothetical protein
MKRLFKKINFYFYLFGIDFIKIYISLKNYSKFVKDFIRLKKQDDRNLFPLFKYYPILNEFNSEAGSASGHYFHQDLYVAQQIFKNNPNRHIDIGSRIDGFVAHVATFRKIEIYDIRNIDSRINNIDFKQADLINLQTDLVDATDSLSCLHALEHFGLGRYGDPIDYYGYLKGFENMTKMLKFKGKFYFSVPIGPQRIEFNAHRVFSIEYLLSIFSLNFHILNFSYVDDNGIFHENQSLNAESIKNNFNCNYGCGIFILEKK